MRPAVLIALAWVLLGAGQGAPLPLLSPDLRVHLVASEDLPADALAALAGPNVVLWLTTRSNALRTSTAVALARFPEAWVQARPQLSPVQAETWTKAPRAGLWLSAPGEWTRRLGARPLAVEAQGAALEGELLQLRGLARLSWAAEGVDLATFARLSQARVPISLSLPQSVEVPDCGSPNPLLGRLTVRARDEREAVAWARCGFRVRVAVRPDLEPARLGELVQAVPGLELEVHVGADERRAEAARRMLGRLRHAATSGSDRAAGPRPGR